MFNLNGVTQVWVCFGAWLAEGIASLLWLFTEEKRARDFGSNQNFRTGRRYVLNQSSWKNLVNQ